MSHRIQPAGRWTSGFTLIELLTACTIVSIALLGVYSIFHDSVQTERQLTQAWQERQAAEAIVSTLCQAAQSAVEVPGMPAMKTGKDPDGLPFFECLTYDAAPTTFSGSSVLQRRRYRWDTNTGLIDLRTIPFSGSQSVAIQAQDNGQDPWVDVEPVVIGQKLKALSIQFKAPTSDKWAGQYKRSELPTAIRVKASVGKASVQRIICCHLTAPAMEGS